HVADLGHEAEHVHELVLALFRQCNLMRIAADRTVVVIRRHRVERGYAGGELPEAAPGRHLPHELADARGLAVAGGDRDGRTAGLEYGGQARLEVFGARHGRNLRPWYTVVNHSKISVPDGGRAPTEQPQPLPTSPLAPGPPPEEPPAPDELPSGLACASGSMPPSVAPPPGGRRR